MRRLAAATFVMTKAQKRLLVKEAKDIKLDISKYLRLMIFNESPHIPKRRAR